MMTGNELPGIEVSKNVSAEFGDKIVLSCNLTISQEVSADQTKLTKLMWAKDGRLIEEVLYPREQSLKSLKIDVERPEVGGIYTCHLTSKLRNVKEYNVTDNIHVTGKNEHVSRRSYISASRKTCLFYGKTCFVQTPPAVCTKLTYLNKTLSVKPKFFAADLKDNEIVAMKEGSVKFVCSAEGNPLQTEWKRKAKYESKVSIIEGKLKKNSRKRCLRGAGQGRAGQGRAGQGRGRQCMSAWLMALICK